MENKVVTTQAPGLPEKRAILSAVSNLLVNSDERRVFQLMNDSKPFKEMDDAELQKATKDCVGAITVITGATIEPEMMRIVLTAIKGFLITHFDFLNCHEVQEAFQMNSVGKLDKRVHHYNRSLNLDYVGEVLQLYCDHRARVMPDILKAYNKAVPALPESVDGVPFSDDDYLEMIELAFKQYRSDEECRFYGVSRLYTAAVKLELIEPNIEANDDLVQKAIARLRGKIAKELDRVNKNLIGEKKQMMVQLDELASGKPLSDQLARRVEVEAMEILLRNLFRKYVEAKKDCIFSASSK